MRRTLGHGPVLRQQELAHVRLVIIDRLGGDELALAVAVGLAVIVIVGRVGIAGLTRVML